MPPLPPEWLFVGLFLLIVAFAIGYASRHPN
jgi:hypothetical protein